MDLVHYIAYPGGVLNVDITPHFRHFNRQWTEVLGLLDHGLLGTSHPLPEARLIFELAQRDEWERFDLRQRLQIDDSFLTRLLASLERQQLVEITPSAVDGRRKRVALTDAGRDEFRVLDQRSSAQVEELVGGLAPVQRQTLLEAMSTALRLVRPAADPVVAVRGLAPGDLGWVVQRHGEIYWHEFGWDQSFEGLVAKIVADHHANARPGRDDAWIAVVDGVRAGCVFCCEREADVAQLRILLVEPWARGLGLGAGLVAACIEFARRAGYAKLVLWTNDVLLAARRIYQAAGFALVEEEPHRSFGHDLVGQTWSLDLLR